MPQIIEMPKLSDTMTVGTLAKWLKKEGDAVKSGDMLAEVETDKATMELESFFDGTLLKIFAENGSQIAIGEPLCAIGKPGEKVDVPAAAKPPASGQTTADGAQKKSEPAPQDKEKLSTSAAAKNEVQAPSATEASGVGRKETAAPPPPVTRPPSPDQPSTVRLKISPLARKLAAEKGIDPSRIQGSGPGGRIVRADILEAEKNGGAKAGAAAPAPRTPAAGMAAAPSPLTKGPIQEERAVPVSNMRAAIARRLIESKTQLPHFQVEVEIDAEPLLALREQLNAALENDGVKLSVNDFVLKAGAEALRRVPQVNASWQADSSPGSGQADSSPGSGQAASSSTGHATSSGAGRAKIQYFAAVHVAFAVAMEDGLITPVIRDAHQKNIFEISTEAKSLGKLARDKKLKPEQFTGGTFCVSNLGMMGIPRFNAIINPPNAAILAVGTTVKKPVVRHDQIVVGQTMVLTLSCDHRVVDGAVGAQYLGALKLLLEAPALLLL